MASMKTPTIYGVPVLIATCACRAVAADPQLTTWYTTASGTYARAYLSDTARTNGTSVTTWSNGHQSQSLPAYTGIQNIFYSSNWIYLRTTGLGTHIMGPWYNDATRTTVFLNYPTNQN